MTALRPIALLALAWVALAPAARADLIRIPDCPPGWEGRRVGHGGHCFPRACTSDASCGDGLRCARVSRCWEEQRISTGRRRPEPGERHPTAWVPADLCGGGRRCDGECRRARECTPIEQLPAPESVDHEAAIEPAAPTPDETAPPAAVEAPAAADSPVQTTGRTEAVPGPVRDEVAPAPADLPTSQATVPSPASCACRSAGRGAPRPPLACAVLATGLAVACARRRARRAPVR